MKIDKNIPIPSLIGRGGLLADTINKMKPGDSIYLDQDLNGRYQAVGQQIKRRGFSFISRKDEKGGRRIWMIEREQK